MSFFISVHLPVPYWAIPSINFITSGVVHILWCFLLSLLFLHVLFLTQSSSDSSSSDSRNCSGKAKVSIKIQKLLPIKGISKWNSWSKGKSKFNAQEKFLLTKYQVTIFSSDFWIFNLSLAVHWCTAVYNKKMHFIVGKYLQCICFQKRFHLCCSWCTTILKHKEGKVTVSWRPAQN